MHKTNPMDQAKTPKSLVWRKKNEGLIKGFVQRDIKQAMVAKWKVFCCYITW